LQHPLRTPLNPGGPSRWPSFPAGLLRPRAAASGRDGDHSDYDDHGRAIHRKPSTIRQPAPSDARTR
jgi:hypothetical protein